MIEIKRISSNDLGTFGVLIKNGYPLCLTAERPWKDNQQKVSCIPEGAYQVEPHHSAKYEDVWHIRGVTGRDGILIHQGNFPLTDSTGCILIGDSWNLSVPGVQNSIKTLAMLKKNLPDNFTLKITKTY